MNLKSLNALLSLRALMVAASVIGTTVCAQIVHQSKSVKPPISTPKKATMSPPTTPKSMCEWFWHKTPTLLNRIDIEEKYRKFLLRINMNLKSSNVLRSLALTMAMSAIGTAVCAQTVHRVKPSTSTTKKVTMTPPESPLELWSRIKILLKKQHGYTSKKDVEDVLGISFKNTEVDGEKRVLGAKFYHSGKQELAGLGLVKMGLFDDPKWSRLTVDWGYEHSETPDCLKQNQVTHDLAALGWDFAEERSFLPGRGSQRLFRKDTPEEDADNSQRGLDRFPHLILFMPNQFSQCVNGFGTRRQHP